MKETNAPPMSHVAAVPRLNPPTHVAGSVEHGPVNIATQELIGSPCRNTTIAPIAIQICKTPTTDPATTSSHPAARRDIRADI
jgi:hypothetical protein